MEWAFSDNADAALLAASANRQGASFPLATDNEFELYVYAALQCGGWFVEPNPKEHDLDNIELFEIDAVGRKPFAAEGQRILAVEAKSGAWGRRDVLLVIGRGAYLGAQGGVLAYRKVVRSPLEDRITARLRELGFQPMRMPDTDSPSTEKVLGSLYQALKLRPRDLDSVLLLNLALLSSAAAQSAPELENASSRISGVGCGTRSKSVGPTCI